MNEGLWFHDGNLIAINVSSKTLFALRVHQDNCAKCEDGRILWQGRRLCHAAEAIIEKHIRKISAT